MPATLVRVLDPSWTSTDKTRTRLLTEGRLPELVEALAQRHDRVDVRLRIDAEVDQERALGALSQVERRPDVRERVDPDGRPTVGVAKLHEVGHVREVDLRAHAAVEVVLELAHHAE